MRSVRIDLPQKPQHKRSGFSGLYATISVLTVSVSDSIAITDAVAELLPLAFNLSDTLSLIDSQTIFQPDANLPSLFTDDQIFIIDSVQVTLPTVSVLTQTATDSFTISDSTSGGFAGLFVVVGDTLTFLDNWNYLTASSSDSINFWADQVQFTVYGNFLITDLLVPLLPFVIHDALQVLLQDATGVDIYLPLFGDSISISDSIGVNLAIAESKSDTITFTDAVAVAGVDLLTTSDSLAFTDSAAASSPTSPVIQPGDFFTISDFVQLLKVGFQAPITGDVISIQDQVNLSLNQDETQTDTITITDTSIENLVIILNVADDLSFVDLSSNNTPNLPDIVLGFGDGVGLSDFVIVGSGEFINLSDPIALSDGVGLDDEVAVALSPSLNSYIRRYLNDVVGVGNMGQGDN